jgi:hypothetical protein
LSIAAPFFPALAPDLLLPAQVTGDATTRGPREHGAGLPNSGT